MKSRYFPIAILFASSLLTLAAQSPALLEGEDLKNREVETINLNEAGKDKLKLGISLGYPMTGITAGWQAGRSLELDALVGSWNYDSFCLGGAALFTIVDLQIGTEIFPLSGGPFVFTGIGNDYMVLSLGGLIRMEYSFDFPLNVYLESGLALNISNDRGQSPWGIPVSVGFRYIF